MSIVYLNGKYLEEQDAVVSINDAGYYYGDGVYEYIFKYYDKLIDADWHLDRLILSLEKAYIKNYPSRDEILQIIKNVADKNKQIEVGGIYLQITRGCALRTHSFINLNLKPSLMVKLLPAEIDFNLPPQRWSTKIVEDPRRHRCDIKMLSLMPMVLSKYDVEKEGYDEVIYYNSKIKSITEGSCYNVWIVDQNNTLITAPLGDELLAGITRKRLIEIAKAYGYKVEEKYYSKEELYNAKEVFGSDSGDFVASITSVDGKQIANGETGAITLNLYNKYIEFIKK